jgi:glycine cleavage system H protein
MSATHYTRDHEYVRLEGDAAVVGITNYAQGQLGDVVFVELPGVGTSLVKGKQVAVVESVKAASEVYAPLSGEVIAINESLTEAPGKINEDPAGDGWFLKMTLANPAELEGLMDEAGYEAFLKTL